MTKEEKVLFLMKLSINSATAFRSAAMLSANPVHGSGNFDAIVHALYEKFQVILETKLDENNQQE